MRHDVPRHGLHVGRQHVVTTMDQSQRPCGRDQPERGARAAADLDHRRQIRQVELGRRPGGQHQPDDVLRDEVVDEHVRSEPLQVQNPLRVQHGLGRRRIDAHPAQDLELLVATRIRDVDLQQEAVPLRLRERVDALGLDRVLRCDHDERLRHRVGLAPDGHLLLGHQLEHRGLHLGGGPVDLVSEDEIDEHRAQLDVETLLAGLVDTGTDDVGGHQVRGELDAREVAADHGGEAAHRQGLGHPGHALEEE